MAILEMLTRGLTVSHHHVSHGTTCPGFLTESSSLMVQDGARKQPESDLQGESALIPLA